MVHNALPVFNIWQQVPELEDNDKDTGQQQQEDHEVHLYELHI